MRLICPNCGAQYEVPEQVIPEAGRDVQCSNCGTTWFQTRDGPADPDAPSADAVPPITGETTAEPPVAPPPSPEPQPVDVERAHAEPDGAGPGQDAPAYEPDVPEDRGPQDAAETDAKSAREDDGIPRRRLDPAVADLLREEAERESRARAADAQPLESEQELGLSEAAPRRAREAPAGGSAPARGSDRSRGSLLPDVDEINRDLRPAAREAEPDTQAESKEHRPTRRSGFSRGFALALLLGVVLVALYTQAGRIAAAVPALAPLLEGYVTALDALRLWAYETITAFLIWIEGLAG